MVEGSEAFASLGREGQKRFLHYALHLVRQSIVGHFGAETLVRLTNQNRRFGQIQQVRTINVLDLRQALEDAHGDVVAMSTANWSSSI